MDIEPEKGIKMQFNENKTTSLKAENISFSYSGKKVIDGCSIAFETGKLTFITGPNGSGKTTLLNLLGGLLKPESGSVTVNGTDLKKFTHIRRACHIGVLPQEKAPALDFSVAERIMMGRFARLPRLFAPGKADHDEVEKVMKLLDITEFAPKCCNRLSGGEYQKVLIASLLVRQTPVMLLDEPTSALDPAAAFRIMKILKELKKECAIGVVSHDLALGAAFADELVLVKNGRIFDSGKPEDVLDGKNIAELYNCPPEMIIPCISGK